MNLLLRAIGITLLLFATASAGPGVAPGQEKPEAGLEALQKQVAALEAKVAALEKQIEKLSFSIPKSFPDLKQLPKGWERREFNGMTYYIIPINQDQKKEAAVIR